MVKDILVCLDGSPGTVRAIELALELAREHGARLVGLAISGNGNRHDDGVDEHRARLEARGQAVGVSTRILRVYGQPAATILEEMTAHDLTILARSARFLVEGRPENAETRDNVLHHARKPVILVPEAPVRADHDVLVAYDGSSAAKRAVISFAESGLAQGRTVHVSSMNDDGAEAWEMASRGVELLRERSVPAKPHSLVSKLAIADALLDTRRKLGAGLLVSGAYARSRLSEMIWGSVTSSLIEKTPVPLFLHH
jgi:nucleotide-binding universal stress UspA family protein